MSQAAPCVLAPLGRGHLGGPLWTVCLGPTQGREVGFLRRAHTQTGKEDWLLFQTPWSPQENCQGDDPTEAGCQPLSCKALWFEETIDAASEDPPGDTQRSSCSFSKGTKGLCGTQSLDWPSVRGC